MPQDIEFTLPFPVRPSRDRGQALDRSLAWATRHGLIVTPVDESRYRNSDIAGLMAKWLPDADGADLDLAVDAVVVGTLLDDQIDGPLGTDAEAVAQVCAELVAVTDPNATAVPRAPLGRAFADVWRRLSHQASPEWLARTRMHWRWYFDAYVDETVNRVRQSVLGVEEYFLLRRRSGFVYAMIDLSEKACGFETSNADRQPPGVGRMLEISTDVIDTLNDVHSLEKEESRGDMHNLVLVMERERRCTRGESMATIRTMVDSWCQEFEIVAHQLSGQRDAVQRLIGCMRDAMSGYLAWSRACRRYSELIPPQESAAATRLV